MQGKRKEFFYQQYNKLHWEKQVETGLNDAINQRVLDLITSHHKPGSLAVYDIGFGIGAFLTLCAKQLTLYRPLVLAGCEPSAKNFGYFNPPTTEGVSWSVHQTSFLEEQVDVLHDVLTAIYVFPHLFPMMWNV